MLALSGGCIKVGYALHSNTYNNCHKYWSFLRTEGRFAPRTMMYHKTTVVEEKMVFFFSKVQLPWPDFFFKIILQRCWASHWMWTKRNMTMYEERPPSCRGWILDWSWHVTKSNILLLLVVFWWLHVPYGDECRPVLLACPHVILTLS
jgi:hypothetical protein